jgi:hypothetical protein
MTDQGATFVIRASSLPPCTWRRPIRATLSIARKIAIAGMIPLTGSTPTMRETVAKITSCSIFHGAGADICFAGRGIVAKSPQAGRFG